MSNFKLLYIFAAATLFATVFATPASANCTCSKQTNGTFFCTCVDSNGRNYCTSCSNQSTSSCSRVSCR